MKLNKLIFSHKNTLTINARPSKQPHPHVPNLQTCSIITPIIKIRKGNSYTSLGKENRKQSPTVKEAVVKSPIVQSLKLRAYSAHSNLKLSRNNQSKLQSGQKQAKQPQQVNFIEEQVAQIITLLKKNFILSQNHSSNFTIKRDTFLNLISYFLLKGGAITTAANTQQFEFLSLPISEVSLAIAQKQLLMRSQKLRIASRVANYTFGFERYREDMQKRTTQLEKLDIKKQSLLKVVGELEELAPALAKEYLHMQAEINETVRKLESTKADVTSLRGEKQNLEKQIQKYRKEFDQVKQASQRIGNYINNQNNKLIVLASQQYKTIESDIYDYASYLQCNQLASSLTYEPLSVTCLTNELEQQLREINRNLVQNETMDVKEKGKAMRDFLLEWMNRFKKKDEEQKEIMKFKTKCVQNFIQKMKKWLQNWTLKQEYLVGLRDEFSMDTEKFKKQIAELSSAQHFCYDCATKLEPLTKNITLLYEKIETNYKLGNSFY